MIILCEACETRFQLDGRRIPAAGARVRCSKCHHAFFVHPEVEAESSVQGVVADTVEKAIPVPEAEAAAEGPGQTDPGLSNAMEPCKEVPPEEWTFSDEPPKVEPEPTPGDLADLDAGLEGPPGVGSDDPDEATLTGVPPLAADPNGDTLSGPAAASLESSAPSMDVSEASMEASAGSHSGAFGAPGTDLGASGSAVQPASPPPSPEPAVAAPDLAGPDEVSQLATEESPAPLAAEEPPVQLAPDEAPAELADDEPPPQPEAPAAEQGPEEDASGNELGDPAGWDFLEGQVPPPQLEGAPEAADESEQEVDPAPAPAAPRPKARRWFQPESKGALAGWLATAVLFTAGLIQAWPGTAPSTAAHVVPTGPSSLAVTGLEAHALENVHGSILVVAGLAPRDASVQSGLRIQLLDQDGMPLADQASWAGPAVAERRLREDEPDALRRELARAAGALTAGDRFHAVFESVPGDAVAVQVSTGRVPTSETAAPAEGGLDNPAGQGEGSG